MSAGSNDERNKMLAADLHVKVEGVASQWAADFTRRRGRTVDNPFTGQQSEIPISDECKALHAALVDAGVAENETVVAAIGQALKGVAHASMFSTLSAIDGSGSFESGSRVQFVVEGQTLESYIHEIYFSSGQHSGE